MTQKARAVCQTIWQNTEPSSQRLFSVQRWGRPSEQDFEKRGM